MSDTFKPRIGKADRLYTHFEQNLALTWAHARLIDFLRTNPGCSLEEQETHFLNSLESGLGLAAEQRDCGN